MEYNFINSIDNTWTLFLDRDGVINTRIFGGYVTSPTDFHFLPGVLDSLRYFSKKFHRIIIVTNQQGVGKGIMTESMLNTLHDFVKAEIISSGGRIDGIYYCTALHETKDNCRKPSPKMAHLAVKEFPDINLQKSIMVGDSHSDIVFGINAGMKTVFIENEYSKTVKNADIVVESLHELKKLIEKI